MKCGALLDGVQAECRSAFVDVFRVGNGPRGWKSIVSGGELRAVDLRAPFEETDTVL